MTTFPVFGLPTVSENEETETQRGSGLPKAGPWVASGSPDIEEVGWECGGGNSGRGGRGELCAEPLTSLPHSFPLPGWGN